MKREKWVVFAPFYLLVVIVFLGIAKMSSDTVTTIRQEREVPREHTIIIDAGQIAQTKTHLVNDPDDFHGIFLEELEEILLADPQNAAILQANSGGASGHIIQSSHLSKNRFVAKLCQQLLILSFIVRIDANSA